MVDLEQNGLSIQLFGRFEARLDGTPIMGLHKRNGERLLAYLALQRGRVVESVAVAGTFWPDTESLDSLRQALTSLRRALAGEAWRLDVSRGSIRLDLAGALFDVADFQHSIDIGLTQHDMAHLKRAIDLYCGPLLQGWDERWLEKDREKYKESYLGAVKNLAAEATNRSSFDEAAGYLKRYVRLRPTEQRAWCDLMRALVEEDERVAAIEVYEKYREYLYRLYKLSPPSSMTDLYQRIRERSLNPIHPSSVPSNYSEPIGGVVPLDSPYYAERSADSLVRSAIARQESIVLVKGSRQTGKSSLLARGLQHARKLGATTLTTDFETLTAVDMVSMDSLCLRLAGSLASQLDLDVSPEAVWKPMLGPTINLQRFLLRHVLDAIPAPIVWGMDEVDRLFALEFNGEFFSMLRSWHEKRAFEPDKPWKRLTLAIACATEAHLYIRDLNKSPFNVGTRVTLEDFDIDQVGELNAKHGSPLADPESLWRFHDLVGGHPYLVRRGLFELSLQGAHSGDFVAFHDRAVLDDGPFGDHLRRLGRFLVDDADLRAAALDTIWERHCSEESFFRLRSAGVLIGSSHLRAKPRCGLYADYLQRRLQ